MADHELKVAVAQFPAVNEIEPNKNHIQRLVQQAADNQVELLVFPEASMCSFASPLDELKQTAKAHAEDFTAYVQSLATQYNLHIIIGVLSLSEQVGESRVTNQLLVIDQAGDVLLRYTKLHLYDAFKFKESDKVRPGDLLDNYKELGVFELKKFKIGLINCYDLRFPELARHLIDQGAEVLSVSAAWLAGAYKEMHWETLLKARAIENTSYVLASGQTAPKNCGQSMIIDPMGFIKAGAGDEIGLAISTLSKERIKEVRTLLPCLDNRRYNTSPK